MAAETTIEKLLSVEAFPQPSLIRLKYPVVLMHGFGMLAALRRNGHMHEHAMHLRKRGIIAYAPNVPLITPFQSEHRSGGNVSITSYAKQVPLK